MQQHKAVVLLSESEPVFLCTHTIFSVTKNSNAFKVLIFSFVNIKAAIMFRDSENDSDSSEERNE